MAATRDTFADYLDTLAADLDEHEMRRTDLAARLQLSRFHLGWITSAVGGESPGRFRRRILLEARRLPAGDHRPPRATRGRVDPMKRVDQPA